MTFYIEPFLPIHFVTINTLREVAGHTKFWYPSRDWLGWRCSSEDPYTPGLWQVCYSSGQARGTLWAPSHTSLTLGSPGGCSSKKIFLKKEKFFEKTGETSSVTRRLRTGYSKKFESIRINLRDFLVPGLSTYPSISNDNTGSLF